MAEHCVGFDAGVLSASINSDWQRLAVIKSGREQSDNMAPAQQLLSPYRAGRASARVTRAAGHFMPQVPFFKLG
ncbi:hypothetical protein ACWHAM_02750 [Paenibacillus terrae]